MHQLELYVGKDEPKETYWITKEEASSIFEQTEEKKTFISIPRLGFMKNVREIKGFGIPPFVKLMKDRGLTILFYKNKPIIIADGYYLEYDEKWQRYEGNVNRDFCKTYEEFIKNK